MIIIVVIVNFKTTTIKEITAIDSSLKELIHARDFGPPKIATVAIGCGVIHA